MRMRMNEMGKADVDSRKYMCVYTCYGDGSKYDDDKVSFTLSLFVYFL